MASVLQIIYREAARPRRRQGLSNDDTVFSKLDFSFFYFSDKFFPVDFSDLDSAFFFSFFFFLTPRI